MSNFLRRYCVINKILIFYIHVFIFHSFSLCTDLYLIFFLHVQQRAFSKIQRKYKKMKICTLYMYVMLVTLQVEACIQIKIIQITHFCPVSINHEVSCVEVSLPPSPPWHSASPCQITPPHATYIFCQVLLTFSWYSCIPGWREAL